MVVAVLVPVERRLGPVALAKITDLLLILLVRQMIPIFVTRMGLVDMNLRNWRMSGELRPIFPCNLAGNVRTMI